MAEAGVDIAYHTSKTINELPVNQFDYVVTLCGHANETCPVLTGDTKKIHYGFDDPPKLAKDAKMQEEAVAHDRRMRDEIKAFISSMPQNLNSNNQE